MGVLTRSIRRAPTGPATTTYGTRSQYFGSALGSLAIALLATIADGGMYTSLAYVPSLTYFQFNTPAQGNKKEKKRSEQAEGRGRGFREALYMFLKRKNGGRGCLYMCTFRYIVLASCV